MVELGTLTITTPANRAMAGVLRPVVMSVASSAELTVDRVEDVALAVSEAFRTLLAVVAPDTPFTCVVEAEEGTLRIALEPAAGRAYHPIELDSLGSAILSGVTDEFELRHDETAIGFTVSNRS